MGLNKFRNQPCPCGSKRKFKYCCLPKHYDMLAQQTTPVQTEVGQKTARYWRKRYSKITTKPLEEPLMTS